MNTQLENGNILKLTSTASTETCISCYEDTNNHVTCCNAAICKTCYLKWLEQKRQCMHCKEDQCDFELWMQEYRIEPEFNPQEYLHNLLQQDNSVDINTQYFGIENLLTLITSQLENPENLFNLIDPGDLPGLDEDFELEFGFTIAPTDANGNQIGQGVTITQNMDHTGNNEEIYNQIQAAMNNYRNLFEQWNGTMNSPPNYQELFQNFLGAINNDIIDHSDDDSEYDSDDDPEDILEWPWVTNNNRPPNCNQQ